MATIFSGVRGDAAVARLRVMAAAVPQLKKLVTPAYTDAMLLEDLVAAESLFTTRTGVTLAPIQVEPDDVAVPTPGAVQESGYDYEPDRAGPDAWGMIMLRRRPVLDVIQVRLAFNRSGSQGYVYPREWLRPVAKSGRLQFLPYGGQAQTYLNGGSPEVAVLPVLATLSRARQPGALRVTYRAGIRDVFLEYPALVQFLYRVAVGKMLEGAFPEQSGSISADGLTRSTSFDLSKYLGAAGSKGGQDGDFAMWRDRLLGPVIAVV